MKNKEEKTLEQNMYEEALFSNYLENYLLDNHIITPYYLEKIRLALLAYYKGIKNIELTFNNNINLLELKIKFKWHCIFRTRILKNIHKSLVMEFNFDNNNIYDEKHGQILMEKQQYTIKVEQI